MPKNTIEDLTNHLFEQIERLNNEDLTNEQLIYETERTKSMIDTSRQILDVFKLEFDVAKFTYNEGCTKDNSFIPKQLSYKK